MKARPSQSNVRSTAREPVKQMAGPEVHIREGIRVPMGLPMGAYWPPPPLRLHPHLLYSNKCGVVGNGGTVLKPLLAHGEVVEVIGGGGRGTDGLLG